ncbi:MAG: hypothetical protein ACM3MK_13425, partial [Chitinophagales bacterium]
ALPQPPTDLFLKYLEKEKWKDRMFYATVQRLIPIALKSVSITPPTMYMPGRWISLAPSWILISGI